MKGIILAGSTQFIKCAPLSRELLSANTKCVETLERIEYVVRA